MAWLLIKDNMIVNSIVLGENSNYLPPDGYNLVYYDGRDYNIGFEWDSTNNKPIQPQEPESNTITSNTITG